MQEEHPVGASQQGSQYDPVVLGHRVRHHRRRCDLTLAELGRRVGRPPSYLSQLENGRLEPKLGVLASLAEALETSTGDLLDPTPPDRRADLEIRLTRLQSERWRETLGLPLIRAGARVDDDLLETLVGLYEALPRAEVSRVGLARQQADAQAR